jgi:hypothetical protein
VNLDNNGEHFPQLVNVDCAICGEPVTIAVEGKRIHPYGLYTTPTVLAGCPHFYRKEEAHND